MSSETDLLKVLSEDQSSKREEILRKTEDLKKEIDLIPSESIREIVRVILFYSDMFWEAPITNLEDHFPPDEYGEKGALLHTKRVSYATFCMANTMELDEDDISALFTAALLHSVCKPVGMQNSKYVFDPNFMINIDNYIMLTLQKAVKEKNYPILNNDVEEHVQNVMQKALRLIHCCEGIMSPIPEVFPLSCLEVIFSAAYLSAKNIHIISDGHEVLEERWKFGN